MLLTLNIKFFLIKCNILRFEEMQTVTQQFFIFKFCVIFLINLMEKESF